MRDGSIPKHNRFAWLTPPSIGGMLTVADIVRATTPEARTGLVAQYVESVWSAWAKLHEKTIAGWYEQFVIAEKT